MKKGTRKAYEAKGPRVWSEISPCMKTYFFQGEATGLIKIGRTMGTAEKRLAEVQPHSPDKLVILKVVNRDIEQLCHDTFREHRAHNEWFKPSPELILFIEQIQ